jgi:hypothetical protein
MRIVVETEIQAAPEIVYDTVTDVRNWPRFITAIESIELVGATGIAPGTRFRETRTMFGRKATEEMTIRVLDRPRLFSHTAESHGSRYLGEHRITPTARGARLSVLFEGRPARLSAWLLLPLGLLFAGTVRRHLAGDLEDVRKEAERRTSAA